MEKETLKEEAERIKREADYEEKKIILNPRSRKPKLVDKFIWWRDNTYKGKVGDKIYAVDNGIVTGSTTTIFCLKCGKEQKKDFVYCSNCGDRSAELKRLIDKVKGRCY